MRHFHFIHKTYDHAEGKLICRDKKLAKKIKIIRGNRVDNHLIREIEFIRYIIKHRLRNKFAIGITIKKLKIHL